jgi:hypothetical protein
MVALGEAPDGEKMELSEEHLPRHDSQDLALERLLVNDRVMHARLDLTQLGLPPEQLSEMPISEALTEQREEG